MDSNRSEDTPKSSAVKRMDDYGDDYEEDVFPPAREPISAKKRKIRRIIFYVVTLVIALIVCSLLSLTVFFKIDEIYVEGTTRYSAEEIIAVSMIKKDDNLILCNTSLGQKMIIEKFPYVEDVDIKKKLFNKIAIVITEAKPSSIIENNGKYYVLSKKNKIIEINDKKIYDIPIVLGVRLKNEKLCDYAEYNDNNIKKYIDDIMTAIAKYNIKDIDAIDINSPTNIVLYRKNGFKIIIGEPENLDYKFRTIEELMLNNIPDNDEGVLDVSVVDKEGAQSFYKSKMPEQSQPEPSKPVAESSKPDKENSVRESSQTSTESSSESEEISSDEEESSEDEASYEDEENSDDETSYEDEESSDDETSYEDEEDSDDETSYEDEEDSDDETSYEDEENSDDETSYEDEENSEDEASHEYEEDSQDDTYSEEDDEANTD